MAVDNKKVKFEYRINQEIRSREVRLVGDNVEQGVYTVQEAQRIANDLELDLVEISPNGRLSEVYLSAEKAPKGAKG